MKCRRHVWLDIARIAALAGWSLPLDRLKKRLVCQRCGSRDVEIRLVYRPVHSSAASVGWISGRREGNSCEHAAIH